MAKEYSSPKTFRKRAAELTVLLNEEQTCLHTGGEMKKFADILYSPYIILLNLYVIPIPEAQQRSFREVWLKIEILNLHELIIHFSSWPYKNIHPYTHSVSPCTYILPPYCTIICNTALQILMVLTLCIDFTGTFRS